MTNKVRSIFALILTLLLIFSLFGCKKEADGTTTETQAVTLKEYDRQESIDRVRAGEFEIGMHSTFAAVSGGRLYYRTALGIEYVSLEGGTAKLLYESDNVGYLYQSGGSVYFFHKDSVFKINGDECEKIFDKHSIKDDSVSFDAISDFALSPTRLYVKSGPTLIEFRHDLRTVTKVYKDVGRFAIKGNDMLIVGADNSETLRHLRVDKQKYSDGVINLSVVFEGIYGFEGGFVVQTKTNKLYYIKQWYVLPKSVSLPSNTSEIRVLKDGEKLYAAVRTGSDFSLYAIDENGTSALKAEGINAESAGNLSVAGGTLYYISRESGKITSQPLD